MKKELKFLTILFKKKLKFKEVIIKIDISENELSMNMIDLLYLKTLFYNTNELTVTISNSDTDYDVVKLLKEEEKIYAYGEKSEKKRILKGYSRKKKMFSS